MEPRPKEMPRPWSRRADKQSLESVQEPPPEEEPALSLSGTQRAKPSCDGIRHVRNLSIYFHVLFLQPSLQGI